MVKETLTTYVDRWIGKAASGGLRNPLLKMPIKRFRQLQPDEFKAICSGGNLVLGTTSDPIARNLYKNYDEKIRERGEHTGFVTLGSIEVTLAGETAGGTKRSALMPVWLQRLELRKQNERINAKSYEEPMWDLNPELPAILQPLGVDAKKGPISNPVQLLQWLSAQLGNRGKVDISSSFIGCFSSQHLVVRERLADGRWRRAFAQNHAVRAKLFGESVPLNDSGDTPTKDSAIEDLGLALPIDDSQLRVVQLASAGHSLVVQGPPGTGKSQTIANLVSNALWRGKRVLVVCDKRTAIRQVEERLVKCNLGPALLNLHDEGLDKKAFLQQAADTFPTGVAALSRFPVAALAELREELNRRVIDGQSIVHPALGIPKHHALSGLIRLRATLKNAPSVSIANWQSLSGERFTKLLGALSEWSSVSAVASNSDTVWNAVVWRSFREDPNARVEVGVAVDALEMLINRLTELRECAALVGYSSEFGDLPSIRDLSKIANLVAVRPQCHANILDDGGLSLIHIDQLESAQADRFALLAKRHPVDLKSRVLIGSREKAEEMVNSELVITWADLQEKKRRHSAALSDVVSLDNEYCRIAMQRGWTRQGRKTERIAQLSLVKVLLDTQVAVPLRWWAQSQGSPTAEVLRWRREVEALSVHARSGPMALDIPALARVAESVWPNFQAIAEDGFNAVSYCLRYRNDRRVKLALKQIYPQLQRNGTRPWLDLVLHALKAHEILTKIFEASTWHYDLRGMAEICFAQPQNGQPTLTEDNLARFERIQLAALNTERLRLRNDLFMLESPIWGAQWETGGRRQLDELDKCLADWHAWSPPKPLDDEVDANRRWLDERIGKIETFLNQFLTSDGDLNLPLLAAWDDGVGYAAKTKRLEELSRYRQIAEATPEAMDWAKLRSAVQWRDEFRQLRGARRLDLDHPSWKQARAMADEFQTKFDSGLKALEGFFKGSIHDGQVFSALSLRLRAISQGMPSLDAWCRKAEWSDKVSAWPELEPFWKRITEGATPVDQIKPLFCYNLLRHTSPQIEASGPELATKLKTFNLQDEQLEKWSISELRARLAKKQGEAQAKYRVNFAEIKRLAGLSRINGTVRLLCQAHLPLLLDLKQAWLMSPISLANLMDLEQVENLGQPFDLVIFDEASQIPVTEGLLPLAFAKQTIIVGDDKQLPPTSFFSTAAQSDYEESDELGESESLIEEFSGSLHSPMLMAHYRSETPDLISFSNREFYDGKLEMYPPSKITGVGRRYHLVPDGVFDSGKTRTNLPEAKAVVKLVEEHVKLHAQNSLGVVAMNAEQMDLIESLLVSSSASVREFCADEERFFIRNLETVQGDEMDRIIVSLTYGKNQEGRFNAAILGPLVRKGGQRRLNVALSRSRTGMTIVSSMTVAHLAGSDAQSAGFACLKRLLEELETTSSRSTFGISHKRFEKREDGGISQLVYCESVFEEEVVEFLENLGLQLKCQYGVRRPDGLGSFRIDIVVVENDVPILAVECDGAAYHRSLSARTRDRARQNQLEKLGWRFHRVWSTNWWHFAEDEKEALSAAIAAARKEHAPSRHGAALGASYAVPAEVVDYSSIPSPRHGTPVVRPSPVAGIDQQRPLPLNETEEIGLPRDGHRQVDLSARQSPTEEETVQSKMLKDWSRHPDWPDVVIGRRLQWEGMWGIVTKTERDGKSLFFRAERSGEEHELSAQFIRMRAGPAEQ